MSTTPIHRAALVVVLLVALGLRLWRLDAYPAGLSHDEAYDALNAVDVLRGARPVFVESNNGREALYMYVVAAAFRLGGVGPVQLRSVSALAGVAAVGLLYVAAREMFGRWTALLAAGLMAVAFWPLFDSRVGLRAALIPAMVVALVYGLWRWGQTARHGRSGAALGWAAAAGVALGLALDTYTPARFLPLLPVLYGAYLARTRALPLASAAAGVGATALAAAVVFAPLGLYFAANPDAFGGRAGQVNDFRFILREGNVRPLVEDTLNTLGMFGVRGDHFMRYDLADRPVFDPVGATLFYAGVVACAAALRRRGPLPSHASALLLLWLLVGLLPSATTGESPHFLRAIGAQPAAFLTAAVGLAALVELLRRQGQAVRPGLVGALAATFVVGTGLLAARDYFVVWQGDPAARRIYSAAYTEVAKRLGTDGRTFVSAEYPADLDRFVVAVARGLRPYEASWFDGRVAAVYPASGTARYYVPVSVRPPTELTRRLFPGLVEDVGELWDATLPAAAAPAPTTAMPAALDRYLELLGVDMPGETTAGGVARVAMHWRVVERPPRDLALFVHLIGERASLWAQNDGLGYPFDQWRPGDRLVQWHDLTVPSGTPPVRYQIHAGGYWRADGQRLAIRREGATTDRLVLGELAVAADPSPTPPPSATRVGVPLGGRIALAAAELPAGPLRAGSTTRFVLFWESMAEVDQDYTVFVHLVGAAPQPAAQADGPPAFGAYPTRLWRPGELVRDPRDLALPAELPPGRYDLLVGLYLPSSGARLPTSAPPPGPVERLRRLAERAGLLASPPRADGDRVRLGRLEVAAP